MIDALISLYATNLATARKLTADLSDEQLFAQPIDAINHPAWIIGHLAFVANARVAAVVLNLPSGVPDSWEAMFNHKSSPAATATNHPDKAALLAALEAGHATVETHLKQQTDALLNQPAPAIFIKRWATVGAVLTHMMIGHEQYHLGQLSTWRRAMNFPRI